jgi:prepilin-type processing-associated H-X9-DG protein
MMTNPDLIKPYARHFGGVNIGFLDGHASWWNSQGLIGEFASRSRKGDNFPLGLWMLGPTSDDIGKDWDSPGTTRSYQPYGNGCPVGTAAIW